MHGEEEASRRSYLMLEGTDGEVYHIYRTPESCAVSEGCKPIRSFGSASSPQCAARSWRSRTWATRKQS